MAKQHTTGRVWAIDEKADDTHITAIPTHQNAVSPQGVAISFDIYAVTERQGGWACGALLMRHFSARLQC